MPRTHATGEACTGRARERQQSFRAVAGGVLERRGALCRPQPVARAVACCGVQVNLAELEEPDEDGNDQMYSDEDW